MPTTLQKSITYLNENIAGLWVEMHESGLSRSQQESLSIKRKTLVQTVKYLESLLPEEETMLREAWIDGNMNDDINLGESKPDLDRYIEQLKTKQ